MLKFTSVSDSVRAITDITLTVTIIRTAITQDLITARTIGTAGIDIIATIIVTRIITGISLTGIATPAGSKLFRASLIFLSGECAEKIRPQEIKRSIFLTLAKRPFWQGFCLAHRSGTLFSAAE